MLDLSHNRLDGPLPARALAALGCLRTLRLRGNRLTGAVPWRALSGDTAGDARAAPPPLRELDLAHNRLSGRLDGDALAALRELSWLDLSRNALTGPLPSAPEGAGFPPKLRYLALSHNALTGAVPLALGAACPRLVELRLDANHLEGDAAGPCGALARACARLRVVRAHGNAMLSGRVAARAALAAGLPRCSVGLDFGDAGEMRASRAPALLRTSALWLDGMHAQIDAEHGDLQ